MAAPELTVKAAPKTARMSTKKLVNNDPAGSESESIPSKKPEARKAARQLVVTTDDDSAAESNTKTPQLPHKKVKEVEQVIEEKTGRKRKERIRDAIEAIQIGKVAAQANNQVAASLSEPKRFGDGPQWRRKLEGREETVVDQSNKVSMKRSNQHVDDVNQPDMVTR